MINKRNCFIYSFALIILIKAMDGIPFMGKIPLYSLLVFSLVWGFILLLDTNFKIKAIKKRLWTKSTKLLYLIIIYYFLWSTIFVYEGLPISDAIHDMVRKFIMLFFVFISIIAITQYRCENEICKSSFIFLAIFMLTLFLLNLRDINLLTTLKSFWQTSNSERYRTLFGYSSNNVAAELALAVIILSFFNYKKKNKMRIILLDFIMFLIIIANNSRGTLITFFFILGLIILLKGLKKWKIKKIVNIFGIVSIIFIIAFFLTLKIKDVSFEDFFITINRYHFLANVNIVKKTKRELLGLGNLSGAFFQNSNLVLGLHTDYMEMFYASVYVRSGIIGGILIAYIIIKFGLLLVKNLDKDNNFINKLYLMLFLYMLVMSLFEQYLFSNAYVSFILFFIICLSHTYSTEISKVNQSKISTYESDFQQKKTKNLNLKNAFY